MTYDSYRIPNEFMNAYLEMFCFSKSEENRCFFVSYQSGKFHKMYLKATDFPFSNQST